MSRWSVASSWRRTERVSRAGRVANAKLGARYVVRLVVHVDSYISTCRNISTIQGPSRHTSLNGVARVWGNSGLRDDRRDPDASEVRLSSHLLLPPLPSAPTPATSPLPPSPPHTTAYRTRHLYAAANVPRKRRLVHSRVVPCVALLRPPCAARPAGCLCLGEPSLPFCVTSRTTCFFLIHLTVPSLYTIPITGSL